MFAAIVFALTVLILYMILDFVRAMLALWLQRRAAGLTAYCSATQVLVSGASAWFKTVPTALQRNTLRRLPISFELAALALRGTGRVPGPDLIAIAIVAARTPR